MDKLIDEGFRKSVVDYAEYLLEKHKEALTLQRLEVELKKNK